ncbi:hypothetical protein EV122DRAFT_285615 [Schizophyllum commune]
MAVRAAVFTKDHHRVTWHVHVAKDWARGTLRERRLGTDRRGSQRGRKRRRRTVLRVVRHAPHSSALPDERRTSWASARSVALDGTFLSASSDFAEW